MEFKYKTSKNKIMKEPKIKKGNKKYKKISQNLQNTKKM